MNIAVGTISDTAREALLEAGGHIEPSKKPGVVFAVLPKGAEVLWSGGAGQLIQIIGPTGPNILVFRRAWQTEQCSIDLIF